MEFTNALWNSSRTVETVPMAEFNTTNTLDPQAISQVTQVPCPSFSTFRHRAGIRTVSRSATASRVVAATPEEAAFLLQARDRFRREHISGIRSERVELLDLRSQEIEVERERAAAALFHMAASSSLPRRKKTAPPCPPRSDTINPVAPPTSAAPAVPEVLVVPAAAMPIQGGGDGDPGSASPWCAGDSTDVSL
jgi:hypothetical protein